MKAARGFSDKIIRIYLIGASILLAVYMLAFHAGVLITENNIAERRLTMVAPFHFNEFDYGKQGTVVIDPLLTLYEKHALLPAHIKAYIPIGWTGSKHLLLEDEREYQVIAQEKRINEQSSIVYAIEDANVLEWDDTQFVLTEFALLGMGILVFLLTMSYMVKAAKHIAEPFLNLAQKLTNDTSTDFDHIEIKGETSRELEQVVAAINHYRTHIHAQLNREKSFTRYVSHELRTPITIIQGALSNLKRDLAQTPNRSVDKINRAAKQMQVLTQTFLYLAREQATEDAITQVNANFVEALCEPMHDVIAAHDINFVWHLDASFEISSHPRLFEAVLHNLLKNAFACSVNSQVSLHITQLGIQVVDNGVGLNTKPRGYEGFGIGLVLVKDICNKYNWQFELVGNESKGCTASIVF